MVRRFDVVLVDLDPTRGSEIRKRRPCVVVSPDVMNTYLRTLLVAPLTRGGREYPTRVSCTFGGVAGWVVLDQLRTIDRSRVVEPLGRLDDVTQALVLTTLTDLFAP